MTSEAAARCGTVGLRSAVTAVSPGAAGENTEEVRAGNAPIAGSVRGRVVLAAPWAQVPSVPRGLWASLRGRP